VSRSRPFRPVRSSTQENPDIKPIDDCTEFQRIKGVWYRITYREITDELRAGDDVSRADLLASSRFVLEDGKSIKRIPTGYDSRGACYCERAFLPIEKRQLNSAEIKRLIIED
jgi:hypothetical protein